MKPFNVTVDGTCYSGLFATAMDAWEDAVTRFPDAGRITVKPAK